MSNNKPGMFSVWKIIGLVIALGALAYKLVFTVYYWDSIVMWWAGTIAMFFILFATSFATAFTTFTRGIATLILAGTMIAISLTFLVVDGLCVLGFAASLNNSTLTECGIFPLVNVLNSIAGGLDLIGFFSLKKKASRTALPHPV